MNELSENRSDSLGVPQSKLYARHLAEFVCGRVQQDKLIWIGPNYLNPAWIHIFNANIDDTYLNDFLPKNSKSEPEVKGETKNNDTEELLFGIKDSQLIAAIKTLKKKGILRKKPDSDGIWSDRMPSIDPVVFSNIILSKTCAERPRLKKEALSSMKRIAEEHKKKNN